MPLPGCFSWKNTQVSFLNNKNRMKNDLENAVQSWNTYTHTHIYRYIHTHIYTHTYIHTHSLKIRCIKAPTLLRYCWHMAEPNFTMYQHYNMPYHRLHSVTIQPFFRYFGIAQNSILANKLCNPTNQCSGSNGTDEIGGRYDPMWVPLSYI